MHLLLCWTLPAPLSGHICVQGSLRCPHHISCIYGLCLTGGELQWGSPMAMQQPSRSLPTAEASPRPMATPNIVLLVHMCMSGFFLPCPASEHVCIPPAPYHCCSMSAHCPLLPYHHCSWNLGRLKASQSPLPPTPLPWNNTAAGVKLGIENSRSSPALSSHPCLQRTKSSHRPTPTSLSSLPPC